MSYKEEWAKDLERIRKEGCKYLGHEWFTDYFSSIHKPATVCLRCGEFK